MLRIIAMLMIVFHHFAVHGGFQWDTSTVTIPRLWYNLISMGGKIGVDIFVLISGYFLIESHGAIFNVKRILKFWGQVIFYSIGIGATFAALHMQQYGIKDFIRMLFPITFSVWWFASTYFVLYLIHPFLNMFLTGLSKKIYQILLIMMVTLWYVIPTFTTSNFQGNELLWFVVLYAIAGYARLYGFNEAYTSKTYFIFAGIFAAITYFTSVVFSYLGTKYGTIGAHVMHFYSLQSVTVLLVSLTLFLAFATMEMNYHKWINRLASATFGVYLIHDNSAMRNYLWSELFRNAQYQNSLVLIPYSIFAVVLVYIVCTGIDFIRQGLFEKPYMWLVEKYADAVMRPFVKAIGFFRKIVFG